MGLISSVIWNETMMPHLPMLLHRESVSCLEEAGVCHTSGPASATGSRLFVRTMSLLVRQRAGKLVQIHP
jgi:hypothetical protein